MYYLSLLKAKSRLAPCLWPRSHYSVFVSIRFRCIEATVPTAPFLYKNGEKNLRFCAFTLICPITKRSHYSVFVKLIVGYWSVFKNLRFCGVFVRISVNTFIKTEVFLSVFVQKRSSVEGAYVVSSSVSYRRGNNFIEGNGTEQKISRERPGNGHYFLPGKGWKTS